MKKLICIMLVIVALATCLVGCGSFTCDLCQKESDGEKHELEILGETVTYCDDCYKIADTGMDALDDLF